MKGVEGIVVYYPRSLYEDTKGKQGTAKIGQVLSNVGKRLVFAVELLKAKFFGGGWVNNKALIVRLDRDVEKITLEFTKRRKMLQGQDRAALLHLLEDIKGAIELLGKFGAKKQAGFVGLAHRVMGLHEVLSDKPTEEPLPVEKIKVEQYRSAWAQKKQDRKDTLSKGMSSPAFQQQMAKVRSAKEKEFVSQKEHIKKSILNKLKELLARAKKPFKYEEATFRLEEGMDPQQKKAVDLDNIRAVFEKTAVSPAGIDSLVQCVDDAIQAVMRAYSSHGFPVTFSEKEGELIREISQLVQDLLYLKPRTGKTITKT